MQVNVLLFFVFLFFCLFVFNSEKSLYKRQFFIVIGRIFYFQLCFALKQRTLIVDERFIRFFAVVVAITGCTNPAKWQPFFRQVHYGIVKARTTAKGVAGNVVTSRSAVGEKVKSKRSGHTI